MIPKVARDLFSWRHSPFSKFYLQRNIIKPQDGGCLHNLYIFMATPKGQITIKMWWLSLLMNLTLYSILPGWMEEKPLALWIPSVANKTKTAFQKKNKGTSLDPVTRFWLIVTICVQSVFLKSGRVHTWGGRGGGGLRKLSFLKTQQSRSFGKVGSH